jgi:hypothetical protein
MGDAFSPEPQGAFLSALDWLDKPGQVVRNTLKGNFAGALRNLGDFGLDAIDAFLPGDWIPELAGEEDKVSGSDLIGLDKEEHPVLGFLGDVGIGTLTDPLTYLTFGASAAQGRRHGGQGWHPFHQGGGGDTGERKGHRRCQGRGQGWLWNAAKGSPHVR